MASIYRGNIQRWQGKTTPASIHGCRVAIKDKDQYFVASGNEVLLLRPTFPVPNENDAAALSKTGLPVPITVTQMSEDVFPQPHLHEIHSILYDEPNNDPNQARLGCIDGFGCASITSVSSPKSVLLPPAHVDGRAGDSGWAGISFDPKNANVVATAHLPSKAIALYDIQASGGPKVTRCIRGLNSPTFVQLMEDGTLLSLEYNQLAVYGTGKSTKGGNGTVVAVGGASRTLTVYDVRKWAICASWSNCLKHSIRSVHFSKVHPDLCYVGGIDAEVIVGPWEGGGTASHFTCLRVDARWVGLHSDPNRDALFGTTASGSPYYIIDPARMYDRAKDAQAALASHPHPLSFDEGMGDIGEEGPKRTKKEKEPAK